jgi:hypothetical protein
MSTRRWRTAAAAFALAGSAILQPVGVAHADCTTAGDFGAGSGCAPPGDSSGSGNAESWPPTSVDWPPKLSSDSGNDNGGDSGGKGGGGGGSGGGAQPTPILMPNGQKPAPATPSSGSNSTSTSTPPKPIVSVGAAPTGTTPSATTSTMPTPIVAAPH